MNTLPLFEGIISPPIIRPIDGNGSVVNGEPLERLAYLDEKQAWLCGTIELHPHKDGLWMWSASLTAIDGGCGYKVGPKWGRFAECRRDAMFHAAGEILRRARDFDCGPRFGKGVRAWAEGLQRTCVEDAIRGTSREKAA